MIKETLNEFRVRPSEIGQSRNGSHRIHLTPRQREVLGLLGEGLTNKMISEQLKIAAATVKAHVGVIFRELAVSNRLQAVIAAHRLGLIAALNFQTTCEASA